MQKHSHGGSMEGQVKTDSKGGKRRNRRATILAFVLVAVIAGGAGVAVSQWQHQNDDTHPGEELFSKQVTDAQKMTLNGDYGKARESLEKALKDPNISNDERSDLLLQKAVVYENENKMDDAIATYKQAESYKETLQATQSIARIAVDKGDKQLAITYYKKALTLLGSASPQARENLKTYFEDAITHLEGSQ